MLKRFLSTGWQFKKASNERNFNPLAKASYKSKYLDYFLESLKNSNLVQRNIRLFGLTPDLFKSAIAEYSDYIKSNKSITNDGLGILTKQQLLKQITSTEKHEFSKIVLPQIFQFIKEKYPDETSPLFDDLVLLTDLGQPPKLYPRAREIKRKIIMHVGPTNSGKTYNALKRLKEANSGMYLGPLRLLAHEVYERMNQENIPFNLSTGEQLLESEGINKWSCTVEMAKLHASFEVCVIDEIQMIGDSQRGWAWTQALLGVCSSEIHLCGEESAVPLVKKLLAATGDSIEVRKYERMTSLEISKPLYGKIQRVTKGDCIVCFSRKDIYLTKDKLEKNNPDLKVAVIYGNLPPEIRTEQARLFNDPKSEYKVLVASDAIGMGLNLNIKRIIFQTLLKFDGMQNSLLTVSQAKQIGGRAGRFGTIYENGQVTTFEAETLPSLKTLMQQDTPEIKYAGILPDSNTIERMCNLMSTQPLSTILRLFGDISLVNGDYRLSIMEDQYLIADLIQNMNLSFKQRFKILAAPVKMQNPELKKAFLQFAFSLAKGKPLPFAVRNGHLPNEFKRGNAFAIEYYETEHQIILLYLWLGIRFPEVFNDIETALIFKEKVEIKLNDALEKLSPTDVRRSYWRNFNWSNRRKYIGGA